MDDLAYSEKIDHDIDDVFYVSSIFNVICPIHSINFDLFWHNVVPARRRCAKYLIIFFLQVCIS